MSSFWKNMYKMKLFSLNFPSSQVCSIAYLKSDDQIMYIATQLFSKWMCKCSLDSKQLFYTVKARKAIPHIKYFFFPKP